MVKNIQFMDLNTEPIPERYYPVPARKMLPEWYKNQDSYLDQIKEVFPPGTDDYTSATVKKCIPIFDTLTAGYLILLTQDIDIKYRNRQRSWRWASELSLGAVAFQAFNQANNMPIVKEHIKEMNEIPKFVSPWGIKTPPGYSSLIVNPLHREKQDFRIIEGIVDTDTYWERINYPFVLLEESFEGLIPAGTPIAQVIPFKRDDWELTVDTPDSNPKLYKSMLKAQGSQASTFFDTYKQFFWSRKSFK